MYIYYYKTLHIIKTKQYGEYRSQNKQEGKRVWKDKWPFEL